MTPFSRSALLLGACLIIASPAFAFDTIGWDWNQQVKDKIDRTVKININLEPTGLVDVEKLQLFIGDVTATSDISNVQNNPASGNGNNGNGNGNGNGDGNGHGQGGGDDFAGNGAMNNVPSSLDARTELPTVVSTATAIANNQSITSAVLLSVDDSQILFGGVNSLGNHDGHDGHGDGGNSNLGGGGLSGALAMVQAGGSINPAYISAGSDAHNIDNASVDSAATAVGNNAYVDLAAATPDDAALIGDFTQAAFADIHASSDVSNLSLSNYTNLAGTGKPAVSSVATAVGNNLNITVAAPAGP